MATGVRPLKIDQVQFGAKVGRHMLEYGRNPASAADRKWLLAHINDIYTVWFYAKGNDVVVTDKADNFGTILKDGALNNTSFRNARILPSRP